ncbi:hypothetical protein ATERTT37_001341 [Aspergillus terreus]
MGSLSDEFPPLAALPQLSLHPSIDAEGLCAAKIANEWLASFSNSLSSGRPDHIQPLFLDTESWWRDIIAFSWDFSCQNGSKAISSYLTSALQPRLADLGGLRFIQAGFRFTTKFGQAQPYEQSINPKFQVNQALLWPRTYKTSGSNI